MAEDDTGGFTLERPDQTDDTGGFSLQPPDKKAAPQGPSGFRRLMTSMADDLVSPAANAWDSLKRDFQGSSLPKDVPDTMLGRARQEFDKLGSVGKLPVDALNLAASPITGLMRAGIARPVSEGMKAGLDLISPKLGAAAPTTDQTMMALSALRPQPGQPPAVTNALKSARPGFTDARAAGYAIPPIDASSEPGMVPNALAAWGGKIKTQQAASAKNQAVTNSLAAQELGLPADTVLDETTFAKVRQGANRAYQTLEQTATKIPGGKIQADNTFLQEVVDLDKRGAELRRDFPELAESPDIQALQDSVLKQEFSPRSGIEAVKRLRFQSKANLKAYNDPAKLELGKAQRDAAESLEDLVERNLATVSPDAVKAYQDARQLIAKSHDIEVATDPSGNVDARKIASLSQKRPFTGNLKTIADAAGSFPKAMQNPSKFGGVEPIGITDLAALAMAPHKLDVLGAVLGRPVARSLSLSDYIQDRLAGLGGMSLSARGAGTNSLRLLSGGNGAPLPTLQFDLPAPPGGSNAQAPAQAPYQPAQQ